MVSTFAALIAYYWASVDLLVGVDDVRNLDAAVDRFLERGEHSGNIGSEVNFHQIQSRELNTRKGWQGQ